MHWCLSEPTVSEMLSDPIIQAVMAADRVAPDDLRKNLSNVAGKLELHHAAPRRRSAC